ncbi:MAG: PadR family transcriptional regulator [Anaerolineae bacterium]|nr:PadR family transcriptional regulator [Anaerolineae bacterium]
MASQSGRELTTLEYVVLGLISLQPQSGYSIINYFSPRGVYSWNASPGTIYPILKRLEKQEIIDGELELEPMTRQRKIYTLSKSGSDLLDEWLRRVPEIHPYYEQREIAMWRFMFMEERLPRTQVIQWLDACLEKLRIFDAGQRFYRDQSIALMNQMDNPAIHRQLIMEGSLMEINTYRTWLEMARTRLTSIAIQTGEFQSS